MNSETWLQKAERLQRTLELSRDGFHDADDVRIQSERIKIALWLRQEFCDQIDDSAEWSDIHVMS